VYVLVCAGCYCNTDKSKIYFACVHQEMSNIKTRHLSYLYSGNTVKGLMDDMQSNFTYADFQLIDNRGRLRAVTRILNSMTPSRCCFVWSQDTVSVGLFDRCHLSKGTDSTSAPTGQILSPHQSNDRIIMNMVVSGRDLGLNVCWKPQEDRDVAVFQISKFHL
jgi:hypothetical protein